MHARVLSCLVLLSTVVVLSQCGQVPGEGNSGSSSSSSSSSGVIIGEPLDGHGQTLVGGSRLKVQYVLGADGSKQLLGFRDTQLNFGCTFYPTTGGGAACIPTMGVLGSPFTNLFPRTAFALYFLDSGCTQPVTAGPPSTVVEYLVDVDTGAAFTGNYEVRALYHAQPVSVTADGGSGVAVYTKLNGSCQQTSLPGSYVFFGRGQEVPMASLVQGQVTVEP